jgi:hypothetical protein
MQNSSIVTGGFWEFNISPREKSFESKFSGYSTHKHLSMSEISHGNTIGQFLSKMPIASNRKSKGTYYSRVFHTSLGSTLQT